MALPSTAIRSGSCFECGGFPFGDEFGEFSSFEEFSFGGFGGFGPFV
jgi:hypothetical protein